MRLRKIPITGTVHASDERLLQGTPAITLLAPEIKLCLEKIEKKPTTLERSRCIGLFTGPALNL